MSLFIPMIGLGLVTSLHCIAMCGPLVMTYAVRSSEGDSLARRALPHAAYQGARVASYVTVGLALGAIGSAIDLTGIRGWVMTGAGALMIVIGLGATGLVPRFRFTRLPVPRFLTRALDRTRFTAQAQAREGGRVHLLTPVVFGLLTGLMPCAPLQAAELASATAGSALNGAIAMLGFGLGTAPLMLGLGTASGYLSARLKRRVFAVAAIAIVVLGFVTLDRGATLLGSPVTSASVIAAVRGDAAGRSTFTVASDGAAEVRLAIVGTKYVPATVSIPAGRRVRLLVDRREADPCSDQLVVPSLGVRADLKPNAVTPVELPSAVTGGYAMTCGMGMMSGRVDAGIVGGGPNVPLGGLLAAALAGLLTAVALRYRSMFREQDAALGVGAPAPAATDVESEGVGARSATFSITGMMCAACAWAIQVSVADMAGVTSAAVDLSSEKLSVDLDPAAVSTADVQRVVRSLGYGATLDDRVLGTRSGAQRPVSEADPNLQ